MNNPINLVKAFRNPQQFLNEAMNNSAISQNPIGKNAIDMYQKGDMQGINQLADNLCKEKGMTREQVLQQIRQKYGI
mgnify:CR=1 FL=1